MISFTALYYNSSVSVFATETILCFFFFLNQNMKTLGLSSSRESLKKILLISWTTIPYNIISIVKISCTQSLASVGTCHMTRSLFLTWEGSRQKLINTCLGIYDILYYD